MIQIKDKKEARKIVDYLRMNSKNDLDLEEVRIPYKVWNKLEKEVE